MSKLYKVGISTDEEKLSRYSADEFYVIANSLREASTKVLGHVANNQSILNEDGDLRVGNNIEVVFVEIISKEVIE